MPTGKRDRGPWASSRGSCAAGRPPSCPASGRGWAGKPTAPGAPRGERTPGLPTEDSPAGRTAAAGGGVSRRGAQTRRGAFGGRSGGDPSSELPAPSPPGPRARAQGRFEFRFQAPPPAPAPAGPWELAGTIREASNFPLSSGVGRIRALPPPPSLLSLKNSEIKSTPPPAPGGTFETQFPYLQNGGRMSNRYRMDAVR